MPPSAFHFTVNASLLVHRCVLLVAGCCAVGVLLPFDYTRAVLCEKDLLIRRAPVISKQKLSRRLLWLALVFGTLRSWVSTRYGQGDYLSNTNACTLTFIHWK